jgi:hypothetical protein
VTHRATASFWLHYRRLPPDARTLADKAFALLKQDHRHPSLHFKKVGPVWSVRVSRDVRALALETDEGLTWLRIGDHLHDDRSVQRTA